MLGLRALGLVKANTLSHQTSCFFTPIQLSKASAHACFVAKETVIDLSQSDSRSEQQQAHMVTQFCEFLPERYFNYSEQIPSKAVLTLSVPKAQRVPSQQ